MWKFCFLSNRIFKKLWEMTKNLAPHPAWLSNPTVSKFVIPSTWLWQHTTSKYCYPCYGFLSFQFENFTNPLHGIFGIELVISVIIIIINNIIVINIIIIIIIIIAISRNYVSIIITIVSNITVLVPHNAIFFGYFMTLNYGVNKKTPQIVSPPHLLLHYQVFTKFAALQ